MDFDIKWHKYRATRWFTIVQHLISLQREAVKQGNPSSVRCGPQAREI
jgi:hypothetical protein